MPSVPEDDTARLPSPRFNSATISKLTGALLVDMGDGSQQALPDAVSDLGAFDTSAPASPYYSKIGYKQVPSLDKLGAKRNGVDGDETLINSILDGHNVCEIKPGNPILVKNSPIIVPPNAKLRGVGGRQNVSITRLNGYTDDTLQMGTPTAGMGSAEIEGLWFTQPGRFLGQAPAGSSLQNRLTNGAAHIRAYGSQKGAIRACGGWGMPYFIAQMGGYGLRIDDLFTIGGFWDRTNVGLQESIAVLGTFYDPFHGHPTCTSVTDPNWVGGNISAETRTIPLYNKAAAYTCQERIGPKYGWLHAAGEDCRMIGGFTGGFNRSNIAILPGGPGIINGGPAWVQIGLELLGTFIDESMWAGIEAIRSEASQAVHTDFSIRSCKLNGQLIGAHAIDVPPSSLMALANLHATNNRLAAYQGAGIRLYAVDGGSVDDTLARGFNTAGFDTTKGDPIDYGVGMMVGGLTRNLAVNGLRGGGGPNFDLDPNNCQWVYADTTPVANGLSVQGNSFKGVRKVNLGLAGGSNTTGGYNDTGA